MRKIIALVAALALAAPILAAKGDMSVATFLAKAEALKAKGWGAIGSPDIKLLRDEGTAAGAAYRARIESDKKAGNAPHSCPPKKAAMKSDVFMAHLQSYPVSVRPKTSIKMATFDLMKKRYPCK